MLVVDAVANEKGVPREVIFDAIEAALASAAKKRYPDQDVLARVTIDHKDGTYETYRRWEVVADDVVMESPDRQVRLMDAIDEADGVDVGDYIEEQIENPDFGRIAAQAAKQVIVQRVREAERQQVVDAWKDRVGELITGVVKRAERGNIFVDLGGNAEAFIPKDKGHSARRVASRRPRPRLSGRSAFRAAWPAAVHQPRRAGIHDRTVQA